MRLSLVVVSFHEIKVATRKNMSLKRAMHKFCPTCKNKNENKRKKHSLIRKWLRKNRDVAIKLKASDLILQIDVTMTFSLTLCLQSTLRSKTYTVETGTHCPSHREVSAYETAEPKSKCPFKGGVRLTASQRKWLKNAGTNERWERSVF